MFHKFLKYISQSISGMIGVSVYILADTFFISYKCGADGLAALNLILPEVYLEDGTMGRAAVPSGASTLYRSSRV